MDCLVSILILLEVVLEAMLDARGTIRDSGFNPYFAGSSSGRSVAVRWRDSCCGFNPYFAGSSSGSTHHPWIFHNAFCFNPYFAGSSSGSLKCAAFRCYIPVSILILLEVVLEELSQFDNVWIRFCFNPYFAGSSSGRDAAEKEAKLLIEFQSLFCWK